MKLKVGKPLKSYGGAKNVPVVFGCQVDDLDRIDRRDGRAFTVAFCWGDSPQEAHERAKLCARALEPDRANYAPAVRAPETGK